MARETKTQLQERLEYESIIIKYDTKKTRRLVVKRLGLLEIILCSMLKIL